MDSFNYITTEGDRWDTLAAHFYGGNQGISILVDANPAVSITAVFQIGTVLSIPIVDDAQFETPKNLPPWKQ